MTKKIGIILAIILTVFYVARSNSTIQDFVAPTPSPRPLWAIRSIDTMKYSRDLAREKGADTDFDQIIEQQVKNIADTGASHIAIATPYDDEFVSFLTRWVKVSRDHKLKVWFRGNFSGWEKWFNYARIDRSQHLALTTKFIAANPTLFEDGDIFTPCPECENGGPGDPRKTRDITGHRQFLIDSTRVGNDAFAKIGKKVEVGYHSMNYDVALAVMDKETTSAVGGIVAIDHYVRTGEKMIRDIEKLKLQSGGQVYLGEIGAPIPDIHGQMSEDEQADWIRQTLDLLIDNNSIIGLNYWVNVGGSTGLWDKSGTPRRVVSVITSYYSRLVTP